MSRRDMRQSAFWILALGFICLVPTLAFSQPTLQLKSYLASNCCATIAGHPSKERVTNDGEAGTQSGGSPAPLVLGVPVEGTIVGDETQYYSLTLSAGQFLHLAVQQLGVDVKVAIFGPDGSKVLEVNRLRSRSGGERARLIAANSGAYRIEISAADPNAPAGKYRVEIAELRSAAADDPVRIRASDIGEEGGGLVKLYTRESLVRAIECFKQAASLWRQIGEPASEGQNLYVAGDAYNGLGEYGMAITILQQALTVLRTPDGRDDASVLTCLGESYSYLSQYQEALTCYHRALEICEKTSRYDIAGLTLNNLGFVYDMLGDPAKALEFFRRSLATWESLDSSTPRELAIPLTNIGGVLASLGDAQNALDYLRRALPKWRQVEDRWGEARVLHRMGVAYSASGQYEDAVRFYEQALTLWRTNGDRLLEAKTLDAAGMACRAQGEVTKAMEYFTLALATRQAIGDRQGSANTLYHIALLERYRGKISEARASVEEAITQAESVRRGLSNDELRLSYFAASRDYYDLYIDLLMQLNRISPTERLDAAALEASERARARSLIELLAKARVDLQGAVDPKLVEHERTIERRLNEKSTYQTRLLSTGASPEAAKVDKEIDELTGELQEVRARIRSTSPHYAAITQPQPLTVSEMQDQVLDGDTLLLEYALGEDHSYVWAVMPERIASFQLPPRREIEEAARQFYRLLTARNERKAGETPSQRQARIKRADDALTDAARLLSRTLFGPVARLLGDKRLLVVADGALQYIPFQALQSTAASASEGSLSAYRPLGVDHEIISLPSASVLAVLRRETQARHAASRAVAVIADPVFAADDPRVSLSVRRHGGKRTAASVMRNTAVNDLVEMPVGAGLRARPSPAVMANSESKAEQRELDVERSLRDVGLAEDATRIPRLPLAGEEANSILSLVPLSQRLGALGFDASRATASDPKLAQYRILHFATHGLLNSIHPELSGLVLSLVDQNGRPQDGFFRLHEIYNLKLPADLVVLSACQTGLGKEIRGEGLVGLTRGFMYAGAKSVVASLWKIDDRATAELMKRFYAGMLGPQRLNPAESLRKAQIELWQTGPCSSPYYWAAFVLQGEWK